MSILYLEGGWTTKSDAARLNATEVAEAACRGWITTMEPNGSFGNVWRLTAFGVSMLHSGVADA